MAVTFQNNFDVRTNTGNSGSSNSSGGGSSDHYVYWLGRDGNLWVNQNGNTFNIGTPVGTFWQDGYAAGSNRAMSGKGTRIDDPNPGNGSSSDSGSYNSTMSAYDASAAAAAAAAQKEAAEKEKQRLNAIAGYDSAISRINQQIDMLPGSLQNKLDSINGEYNTYKNEQQSNYNQQKNSYDTSSRQNMNSLVDSRNQITDKASIGLQGLLAVLGAHGAGGSSVALYNVPNMVKRQADYENNSAGSTYRNNQQNLDTNWGNYLNSYENDKKKLEDWRTGQEKAAKQENEQTKINLLNQLSQNYTDRAQYDYNDPKDTLNSINERIMASNRSIQDLGKYTTPNYTGTTAVYNAPELSSYDTGKMKVSTDTSTGNSSAQNSSLLTVLQNLNEKKKDNNGFGA